MSEPAFIPELLRYIDSAPTAFHAAARAAAELTAAGFQELRENESWNIQSEKTYFVIRNDASIIAFRAPGGPVRRARMIGAHTDSPHLRLKPAAEFTRQGYVQLGIEVYGGVLWNSWLDRDLSVAGRLFHRQDDRIVRNFVHVDRPIARIPQLAIHLDRGVNEGLKLNPAKELAPALGLTPDAQREKNSNRLLEFLAREAGINREAITGFDLALFPVEPARVAGLENEFILAPRLDNLAMCHAALLALQQAAPGDDSLALIALFDNEEIGSATGQGAASPFLSDSLERIYLALGNNREEYLRGLASALFLSADMAHAVHPNYTDRHDEFHRPRLNQGPVIKYNSNQRYATDGASSAALEALCRAEQIPYQKFSNRSDLPCGSTIGPITATRLGIPVVDAGNPMLSMHSAREMAGTADHGHMVRLMRAFLAG